MALRANPWRHNHILGFKPTRSALKLEDADPRGSSIEGIVGQEVTFRREAFHSDRHITLLLIKAYSYGQPTALTLVTQWMCQISRSGYRTE